MEIIESEELNLSIVQLLTTEQAWHFQAVPKDKSGNKLFIYSDGVKTAAKFISELELLTGLDIEIIGVDDESFKKMLLRYYRRNNNPLSKEKAGLITDYGDDFLDKLITEARALGSSDIHIEASEEKCRVRIRIDGMLIERYEVKKSEYPSLVNKIKIKANLDIAEKRLPQDGRIQFVHKNRKTDIRVSILPTLHGEKIVMRLLNNDATNIDIEKLGFNPKQLAAFLECIKRPHGIILISGPTGSGKTTTLYATLKILNNERVNILTIEDPIEYTLQGINQVQLKEGIGLTFAAALRTFLRQDPDIIMLGEIRDAETAQMAIRASLTGHLVLSTIHTNSALGTISRLIDMGIPAYLIAGTLNCSVAQRLVRLLCPHCKQLTEFNESLLPAGYKAPQKVAKHFTPKGCQDCYYTGYSGRKAIYEVLPVTHETIELIKSESKHSSSLMENPLYQSISTMAFHLFLSGETSIDEVFPLLK